MTPVWFLERFPHKRVILDELRRRLRGLVGPKGPGLYGEGQNGTGRLTVRLSASSGAADEWKQRRAMEQASAKRDQGGEPDGRRCGWQSETISRSASFDAVRAVRTGAMRLSGWKQCLARPGAEVIRIPALSEGPGEPLNRPKGAAAVAVAVRRGRAGCHPASDREREVRGVVPAASDGGGGEHLPRRVVRGPAARGDALVRPEGAAGRADEFPPGVRRSVRFWDLAATEKKVRRRTRTTWPACGSWRRRRGR